MKVDKAGPLPAAVLLELEMNSIVTSLSITTKRSCFEAFEKKGKDG